MSAIEELTSHPLALPELEYPPDTVLAPALGHTALETQVLMPTPPLEVRELWDLSDDLLVMNVQTGPAIAAQLELCFYGDGRTVDIEEYKALGVGTSPLASDAYETAVNHLASNGFIEKIEYWAKPEKPDVFSMQAQAAAPDAWQKRLEVQQQGSHNQPLEINSANLDLAMALIAEGKGVGIVLSKLPESESTPNA